MKVISSIKEMQEFAEAARRTGLHIGLVPTMGFLHEGHLSLIRLARKHCELVVTTIFVNPTQFSPNEDYDSYPRDLQRDKLLAEEAGSDALFIPDLADVYPPDYQTYIEVGAISEVLEGAARPSHFRGVATIVAKLFNITKPHVAVFGQKDAQQVAVIRRVSADLNFDVKILVGPTVREADGLAMSSRNVYLSPSERTDALVLFQSLVLADRLVKDGERDCARIKQAMIDLIMTKRCAQIDYVSIADAATLREFTVLNQGDEPLSSLAVRIGKTRLIDNYHLIVP